MERATLDNQKLRDRALFNNGDIAIVTDMRDLDIHKGAYQADLYAVVLCEHGRSTVTINGKTHEVGPNDLFVCTPNIIIESGMMSVDFESKCLCMSIDYLQKIAPLMDNSWNVRMVFEANPLIHLSDEEAATFHLYYDLICSRLHANEGKYLKLVITALIQAFFYEFRNTIERVSEVSPRPFNSRESHFKAFMDILSTAYPKPRKVSYYAERLCITPKYLSSVCKEVGGETPLRIIEQYVMKDIEYQLTHTTKSIKDISNELDFPSISFFGKYVKANLGMSPKAFRDKLLAMNK